MRTIRIENVSKSLNGEMILDNLSLEIKMGQFFALLGPSGCGKTTLLRLIAGLDRVDSGRIYLGDEDITYRSSYERRSINTVFQQYALFPHLNVFENVAYSLRLRNIADTVVNEKVFSVLKAVRLRGHEFKHIKNLSGGQQQRVALARAIVNDPVVLLLDEPLAALDLKLREQMLIELIDLQDKLRTTFVYVTHDQSEALTVADKMAIMSTNGRFEQLGTPKEIYEFPTSRFVANFVGSTNIMEGTLHMQGERYQVEVQDIGMFSVWVPSEKPWMISGTQLFLSIRPEKIYITKTAREGFDNHQEGIVMNIIYYGPSTKYQVRLKSGMLVTVFVQNEEHFPHETIDYDDHVHLYFQKENIVLLER